VRLSESLMDSVESSYQQGVMIEEEDQRNFLIIGGIKIFLPSIPLVASASIKGAEGERMSAETVKEEIE